jgi:CDP-diacylglycerol--glycerol-3-phosphate 3-phosphatidyltransferase
MYKAIPNILSFSRMGLALSLLLTEPLSFPFLAILAVCGLTDVLDGLAARKLDARTEHGHAVDSMADVVLAAVLLYCIVPVIQWEIWMILWIAAIAAMRLIAFGIGSVRYGRPAFVHTYLNKLAGVSLFLAPFLLALVGAPVTVASVCAIASVSAAEYLYINASSEHYDPDLQSAFVGRS